jgi:hypothetical protein
MFCCHPPFELPSVQYICVNYTVKQNLSEKENHLTFCGNFLFKSCIQAKQKNIWLFFVVYMQL